LARFAQANYLDCRISAYPPNAYENISSIQKYVGLENVTPSNIVVMVDLDRCNFTTDRGFKMALSRTLNNIKEKLGTSPTVLWSGRGYHIILPLNSNGVILENIKEFEGVNNVSLKFLRYAEYHLSVNKSDSQHNHTVSFNNCMLRIPGSTNSKNGNNVVVNNISYTFQKYLLKITFGNGVIITVKEYTAFWHCQQCLDFCVRWFSKEFLGLRSIQKVHYCHINYQLYY
jgi:hypothetical protein